MNEAGLRAEVFDLLVRGWYWPVTQEDTNQCPRCHTLIHPPKGRPDVLVLSPRGPSVVVEVKAYRKRERGFPFSRIKPEQRHWLDLWAADEGRGYLALGTVTGRAGTAKPRYLWVVPWISWLDVEAIMGEYQKSLPLNEGSTRRPALKEKRLYATFLLAPWQCTWSEGRWHLPALHPLWQGGMERDKAAWYQQWELERR